MLVTNYDNLNPTDRLARLILGAVLIAVIFQPGFSHFWVALTSVYPIMTAIMAWDPIYALLAKLRSRIHHKTAPLTHASA